MKNILLPICIYSTLLLSPFTTRAWGIDGSGSLNSGSMTRTFVYHAPGAVVGNNLPVMIIMHGDGGTGAGIKGYTGFDAIADANNFIAVYPDAADGSWNRYADAVPGDAGLGNPDAPDDVLFISDLIDHLCETFHINPDKVYATGHSAGGYMAYNLAVQLPQKIAAIAPVSASLWGETAYLNNYFANTYTPVPIMHIHGDNDGTVEYPDPNHTPDAWSEWPLTPFSYANCAANTYGTVTDLMPNIKRLNFCGPVSATNKEVYLVRIMGGTHNWPNVAGYNPAQSIWEFCNTYTLNTGMVCNTAGTENEAGLYDLSVYPVPANETLYIAGNIPQDATIQVIDLSGKILVQRTFTENTLDISGLTPGIYFLSVHAGTYIKRIKFTRS